MRQSRASSAKKLALSLPLFLLIGCSIQAEKEANGDNAHSSTSPKQLQLEERETLDNKKVEIGNLKILLHAKMLEFLDNLTANEAFAYLNNNSGQVETLIIVKHHPEIFSHRNKDSYVLCVSAKNAEGDTYPVDIYIKQGIDEKLFVYDMRIGGKERKDLMALMQKSVFYRL